MRLDLLEVPSCALSTARAPKTHRAFLLPSCNFLCTQPAYRRACRVPVYTCRVLRAGVCVCPCVGTCSRSVETLSRELNVSTTRTGFLMPRATISRAGARERARVHRERAESRARGGARRARTQTHAGARGAVDVAVGGNAALGGNTQAVQQEQQRRFTSISVWLLRCHPEPNLTQPEIGLVRQLRLSQSPDATTCRPCSLLPACHPRSLHVGDRGSCARFDAQHGGEQDCYPSEARHGEWRQASTRDKEEGSQ